MDDADKLKRMMEIAYAALWACSEVKACEWIAVKALLEIKRLMRNDNNPSTIG